jgi:hypothetical protein
MKLEVLKNLIEAADYMTFRELALLYLKVRGFSEPVLRDGWKDGGSDVSVSTLPPNPTGFAIQVSVEKKWKAKMLEDARKAKRVLGLTNFLMVSGRRIAEVEYNEVHDELFREGINALRADSQDLASMLVLNNKTVEATAILGIPYVDPDAKRQQLSPRNIAAYSYMFFGNDPNDFREEAVQSTIKTTLAVGPMTRAALESRVVEVLQIPETQKFLVTGCIDQLLQAQVLEKSGTQLVLVDWVKNSVVALSAIRNRQHDELKAEISELLFKSGVEKKHLEQATIGVIDDLGALLIEAAHTNYNVLSEEFRRADLVLAQLRQRLQHLHSLLDSTGVSEGGFRKRLIEKLTAIGSASPYGKSIIAGELFLCLTRGSPSVLMRAMGDRIEAEILLDASVAIPMIAGLLFKPTGHKYFLASNAIYQALRHHKIPCYLPEQYLGEVAAHLVHAFKRYADVISVDPDLEFSENAFVAHFVGLSHLEGRLTFDRYLRLFGLDDRVRDSAEPTAIATMKGSLRNQFAQYGIPVKPLYIEHKESVIEAEKAVAHILNRIGEDRLDLLVRHDVKTTAYLYERANEPFKLSILTSWDGLHFRLHQEAHKPLWETINPGVLSDLLNLTAHVDTPLVSPLLVAKTLSEEQARRGALIWDTVVQIQKGDFHDAEVIHKAQEFKRDCLSRKEFKSDRKTISAAWNKWKRYG